MKSQDMAEAAESRKPWQVLCECSTCKDRIFSRYSGEFVSCKCGESFVDQTPYYGRYGGNIKEVNDDDCSDQN